MCLGYRELQAGSPLANALQVLLIRLHERYSPAVEGFYAEINGIKQIFVSLEAEIFADQHIQNPLKSASGKSC